MQPSAGTQGMGGGGEAPIYKVRHAAKKKWLIKPAYDGAFWPLSQPLGSNIGLSHNIFVRFFWCIDHKGYYRIYTGTFI